MMFKNLRLSKKLLTACTVLVGASALFLVGCFGMMNAQRPSTPTNARIAWDYFAWNHAGDNVAGFTVFVSSGATIPGNTAVMYSRNIGFFDAALNHSLIGNNLFAIHLDSLPLVAGANHIFFVEARGFGNAENSRPSNTVTFNYTPAITIPSPSPDPAPEHQVLAMPTNLALNYGILSWKHDRNYVAGFRIEFIRAWPFGMVHYTLYTNELSHNISEISLPYNALLYIDVTATSIFGASFDSDPAWIEYTRTLTPPETDDVPVSLPSTPPSNLSINNNVLTWEHDGTRLFSFAIDIYHHDPVFNVNLQRLISTMINPAERSLDLGQINLDEVLYSLLQEVWQGDVLKISLVAILYNGTSLFIERATTIIWLDLYELVNM